MSTIGTIMLEGIKQCHDVFSTRMSDVASLQMIRDPSFILDVTRFRCQNFECDICICSMQIVSIAFSEWVSICLSLTFYPVRARRSRRTQTQASESPCTALP